MVVETKIRKIGNSLGIILPKEAIQQLDGKEGKSVYLTKGHEGTLQINQGNNEFRENMELVDDLMDRYHNALKELAK